MKIVLAPNEFAGFSFKNKKECRALLKDIAKRLKKIPPKTTDFEFVFRVEGIEPSKIIKGDARKQELPC